MADDAWDDDGDEEEDEAYKAELAEAGFGAAWLLAVDKFSVSSFCSRRKTTFIASLVFFAYHKAATLLQKMLTRKSITTFRWMQCCTRSPLRKYTSKDFKDTPPQTQTPTIDWQTKSVTSSPLYKPAGSTSETPVVQRNLASRRLRCK